MKYYLFCFGIFLAGCLPVHAAEDWKITTFNADMAIQSDGKVAVTETVVANFGNLQKHGIYRNIPYEYQDRTGNKVSIKLENISVERNGRAEPVDESYSGGYLDLKIGSAATTVSGVQSYAIHYLAAGILGGFANYDELYWNVTGNKWEVPIETASATVSLPRAGVVQATCYVGPEGSTQVCPVKKGDASATFTSQQALNPGEGLTVALGYTKDMVPLISTTAAANPLDSISWHVAAGVFLVLLAAGCYWVARKWQLTGRDASEQATPISGVVVPEYEAPGGLRPAEIGLLLDEKTDTVDISATIVDLAVRGYLTITEVPKKWLFGSSDYSLNKVEKSREGLMNYEIRLLDALFGAGPEVTLSALKNTFYRQLADIKHEVYLELTRKRLFAANPETVRATAYLQGVVVLAIGIGAVVVGSGIGSSVLLGAGSALALVGMIILVTARAMPRRTVLGRQLYQKALGYRLFLSATEKYRQPFFEKQHLFMEVLPYAIVFGVTAKLAKAMSQMGVEPAQPGWYYGVSPFNALVFGDSISSFSDGLNSAMASTPSGSGSGGGGFSGGGFGGGGGGSW